MGNAGTAMAGALSPANGAEAIKRYAPRRFTFDVLLLIPWGFFQPSGCSCCRPFLSVQSVMSRFGKELVKLKCTVCNEHGLMRCPACRAAAQLAMEDEIESAA
jgi:hypothetical protein